MYSKSLIAAALLLVMAAFSVFAQVEVEDRFPVGSSQMPPPQPQVSPGLTSGQQAGELYYQLQVLQQEVLELRGAFEEQAHELKRLKQQRLDDYLDLDRRLSALGQAGDSRSATADASVVVVGGGTVAPEEEIQRYRAAIDLVLKKQRYDEAVIALKEHLDAYPNGRYAANSTYWLGEIYLLKNDLEQSRQWFTQLLSQFPQHRKVPDGKFKLGKVYHLLGNDAQAKTLLDEVAASRSDAAPLARDYLRDNFNS